MRRTFAERAPLFVPLLVSALAWACWLGWDQHKDVLPDGSESGPYQAWQVLGLVLTAAAAVCWSASRGPVRDAVAGTTAGLAGAAWLDWSGGDGLYVIGVAMVAVGAMTTSAVLAAAVSALARRA
ncbi:hypothetical protein [Streptomyces sp. TLI_171]|uniref:hypothetical protein n=1 Tax=Streptomyces sp. TLI_171 TaxID=1938859 RepID=UPI000C1A498B|nr:hypothetical protein [Streptomyces sp. TLI_171]RKE19598.1 hypothetical protein BX266_2923 [Streptomyces sp. TLI_171]